MHFQSELAQILSNRNVAVLGRQAFIFGYSPSVRQTSTRQSFKSMRGGRNRSLAGQCPLDARQMDVDHRYVVGLWLLLPV